MFLHAGFWHIAGNIWFLWMFGRRVENSVGTLIFVLVYFASGLGGAGMHWAAHSHSAVPCIGASGAISGVVGCFFVLFPRANFDLSFYLGWWHVKTLTAQTTAAVGVWVAEQTLLGVLSEAVHFSPIAFWGHLGGFVTGVLSACLFRRLRDVDPDGFPRRRTWFHNREVMSKADLTRLDLH